MTAKGITRDTAFALVAILLLAFNLRPVATSVGPVLELISADLGMGDAMAGVLTALPALCFAVFGACAPWLSSRIGPHRTIGIALVLLVAGQAARAWVPDAVGFLLLSIVALAGMALSNVLLPTLVRLHFPRRIGLATSLYSLMLTMGTATAGAAAYPLAEELGSWRGAFTAITVVAVAALICWLPMLRYATKEGHHTSGADQHTMRDVSRTRRGWAMAMLFGIQSGNAYTVFGWLPRIYTDAGMDPTLAGVMLAITTGVGIVPAFFIPVYAARKGQPVGLFLWIMGFLAVGYLGLLLAPTTVPWLWAICMALGISSFPLILALLGMRARTASGTAALSGFTQSVGYLVAAGSPLLVGVLRGLTGSFQYSIGLQLILIIPMIFLGIRCCRTWFIEDELTSSSPPPTT